MMIAWCCCRDGNKIGVQYNTVMDASVVEPSSGSPQTITCRTSSLVSAFATV